MKNSGGVFIGTLVAAAAGVILGMLIAPKKGEHLRQDIKDTADDWSEKLDNLLSDGKEEFKKAKSSFAEGDPDYKSQGKGGKV